MRRSKLFVLAGLCILVQFGCDDHDCAPSDYNNIQEGLLGKWNWIQSQGGFAGQTLTPESEGYTLAITLDEFYYTEFKNDSLIFKAQYDFDVRPDSIFGSNTFLVLESGFEFALISNKDTLKLREVCFDCFDITYVKD